MRIGFPAISPDIVVELWRDYNDNYNLFMDESRAPSLTGSTLDNIANRQSRFYTTLSELSTPQSGAWQIRILFEQIKQTQPCYISDISHTLACNLAFLDKPRKSLPPLVEPLLLFSASFDKINDSIGEVGTSMEFNSCSKENPCSLKRKWDLACASKADALFLHERDADHLHRHHGIEVHPLQVWNKTESIGACQLVSLGSGQFNELCRKLGMRQYRNIAEPLLYKRIIKEISEEELKKESLASNLLIDQAMRQSIVYRPVMVDSILGFLEEGKSIFIEGKPGCGKSGLAAWTQFSLQEKGYPVSVFQGGVLGLNTDPEALLKHIKELHAGTIVILDDSHLMHEQVSVLLNSNGITHFQFLILARFGAKQKLKDEEVDIQSLKELFVSEDEEHRIAEHIAFTYVPNNNAVRILEQTSRDLVYTKWVVSNVVLNETGVGESIELLAQRQLRLIHQKSNADVLRLFLLLAAYKWVELPCPYNVISYLSFSPQVIDELVERRSEATHTAEGILFNYHPKLAKLFTDASQAMPQYSHWVFFPLIRSLQMEALNEDIARKHDFTPLALGIAVIYKGIDYFWLLEEHLVFSRLSDQTLNQGMDLAKDIVLAAIDIEAVRSFDKNNIPALIKRFNLAFFLIRAVRLSTGGEAAKLAFEQAKRKLSIEKYPEYLFQEKGYFLYQEAYMYMMANDYEKAKELFEESALADETWVQERPEDIIHWAKAGQSRNGALFTTFHVLEMNSITLDGGVISDSDNRKLTAEGNKILEQYQRIENKIPEHFQERFGGFVDNCLHIMARLAAWRKSRSEMEYYLDRRYEKNYLNDWLTQYAEIVLAYASGDYVKIINESGDSPVEMMKKGSGENVGSKAQILAVANYRFGKFKEFEKWCRWLISDEFRADSGEGLIKEWAKEVYAMYTKEKAIEK